tara:strand:+ start:104 stop:691 length:588 start_codon:yes stop_codon:yes gene_type:complete
MWQAVKFDNAAKERIQEAAAFEKTLRLEAFLDLPTEIGPFSLRPITGLDLLHLDYTENRLLSNEEPGLDDYVSLLWMLKGKSDFKQKFFRGAAKALKDQPELKGQLQSYLLAALNDLPPSVAAQDEFPSSVWLCPLVDAVAASYGWEIEYILGKPISVILQLYQRILQRTSNGTYIPRNGITQQAKAREMGLKDG